MVPLNDLKRMYDDRSEALETAGLEVMRSGWWLNGHANDSFCTTFAKYVGVGHCIGVANGTDALELSIRALLQQCDLAGEQTRNEVITVANAGGYTVTSSYNSGCIPVYVDVEENSLLISIDGVLSALTDNTLCVVVTHLYGGLSDVMKLRSEMDIAGYQHVAIVEDCAQAHGLLGKDGMAGSLGTLSTFSFYPTKNLGALGDGGAIGSNDENLTSIIRQLQKYGWGTKYNIDLPRGRNSRLDEIQAAFLSALLPSLQTWNEARCKILEAYETASPEHFHLVKSPLANVGHLAVVITEDRDSLAVHMKEHGVATDVHFPVLDCDQAGWAKLPHRIGPGGLNKSRRSVDKILTLPCFPLMTEEEISIVVTALRAYKP